MSNIGSDFIKNEETKEELISFCEESPNHISTNSHLKPKLDTDPDKLKSKYVNGFIKIQDTNGIVFNSQVIKKKKFKTNLKFLILFREVIT